MLSKLSKTLKEKVAHSSTTVRQRKKAEWCFQGRGRRGGEEGRGMWRWIANDSGRATLKSSQFLNYI